MKEGRSVAIHQLCDRPQNATIVMHSRLFRCGKVICHGYACQIMRENPTKFPSKAGKTLRISKAGGGSDADVAAARVASTAGMSWRAKTREGLEGETDEDEEEDDSGSLSTIHLRAFVLSKMDVQRHVE